MAIATAPNQYTDIPIFNALIPSEGPKGLPLTFDFTAQSAYPIDLTLQVERGVISAIQSFFIDNSANSGPLTITILQSGQVLKAPGGYQGYVAALVPNPPQFTVSCAGGSTGTIVALNIPTGVGFWPSVGGSNTYSAGKLLVSDPAVESAIASGQFQSLVFRTGSGGISYPQWIGNLTAVGAITASAAAIVTGAPGYFVTGLSLFLSPNAAQASAGDWTAVLSDSTTGTIFEFAAFVPAVAPTLTAPALLRAETPGGWTWNNKLANSTLSLNLSATLTTGKLYYTLAYGQTGIVG
jgi:hypothetical protein